MHYFQAPCWGKLKGHYRHTRNMLFKCRERERERAWGHELLMSIRGVTYLAERSFGKLVLLLLPFFFFFFFVNT